MIDMHNHILMDMDDGPRDEEAAIELLRQANKENINEIIATPHYTNKYDNSFEKVKLKIKRLCKLKEVNDLGISMYPGQEVRFHQNLIDDIKSGKVRGLNSSRYLLIEFPPNDIPDYTFGMFNELQVLGYITIIAHPERNLALLKDMSVLYDLVKQGALSQLTSTSLIGHFGKGIQEVSIELMNCKLVHFIASDAHDIKARPFVMKSLFEDNMLLGLHGQMKKLIRNAKVVIENKEIEKYEPLVPNIQYIRDLIF
ncbi:tyrosine-protein phosphatase [Staphylococcus simulans]|uniref:tyrosine-protein phosphatase n=1 Tax=Staphylococcus simulans TaxID=1286 RepID=UPI00399B8D56